MTTLEGDLGPLVAADRTSDNRFAGSGVPPVICRLGPESLLQHPRKGRPLCNTLWLDSGIAHRRVCVQGYASRFLATTHAFANHHLFQGFATGFHGTASNCSCTHHAAFLVGVTAWPCCAKLTNAPPHSVCGATSQLHRRCLVRLGVAGSCLPAEQPNSARASRQGGPEPTPRAASGGASRPDATKAACESESAAPSSRGVPPNGSVEASCARATSTMPESERNTACKKLRLPSPVAMYRFDRAGAGLLSARAARSPGQPKPKNHALVPCTSCLN